VSPRPSASPTPPRQGRLATTAVTTGASASGRQKASLLRQAKLSPGTATGQGSDDKQRTLHALGAGAARKMKKLPSGG